MRVDRINPPPPKKKKKIGGKNGHMEANGFFLLIRSKNKTP